MKVSDLIKELQSMDQNAVVVTSNGDYGGSYSPIGPMRSIDATKCENAYGVKYYGKDEDEDDEPIHSIVMI